MVSDTEMGSWTDLLHSSSKLLEQAAPSAQFPPLQRNLDQLEALSKKLKAKTLRTEAPTQSIAATRLLAREGINAEQLAQDLKSFELKTTFEDVFPAEATSVEEYLQQVHEMAKVSAIQEAQKDNISSFNDYMMTVLQEDWQKEKRDFLQSVSSGQSSMEIAPLPNKPVLEKKAVVYADVVKNLNHAREHGLPFKPATAFKGAYESLGLDASGGKSVTMQKIWHLIQTLMGEGPTVQWNVSKKMSLVIGARHHLEWGHEKYIVDTIQSHPAQAALGGAVGNLQRIHAFLRVRLRDYGVLDFDACRQPPVDTTWQQIYFCLRTGYYDEARKVASSSRVSHHFAPQLSEWVASGGMVSPETAAAASEECEKLLRMGDRVGRAAYDKKKLLLYAILSGSHRHIDCLLREFPTLFNTIEDFLWFKLSAIRDYPGGSNSAVPNEGYSPYSLDDLQDMGDEGYNVDTVHISIVLADHGVLSVNAGAGQKLKVMDAFAEASSIIRQYGSVYAEASSIIRQYGSVYLRHENLLLALEYYMQAAAAVGGGQLSWSGRVGRHLDALKEVAKLPFLPLDPRAPDLANDMFQSLSHHVQACVPDLLKVALHCLDNLTDSDGSLLALRTKIANFLANNLNRNWPQDLYEKVARSL
ncbi:hypothetical protein RHGRI_036566 [Rhododendron griersonianum]|uniref:Nuclear pore protein n=1 Tax=Rhododendron griersonianum TaxID=479676 RepID=A0AAV6HP94_9ERIC|nr:hypothetical protein RHGRI_036566 [Rhododendron griersonianum]